MTSLKQILSAIFWPFQGVQYYQSYINLITKTHIYRNQKYIRLVKILNLVNVLSILNSLYLAFTPALTELDHILHHDALLILIKRQKINICAVLCGFLNLYYNYALFLKSDFQLNWLLHKVIVQNNGLCFNIRNCDQTKACCERTRKSFILIVNLFQTLVLTWDLLFFQANIIFIYKIYSNWSYFMKQSLLYDVYFFSMYVGNGICHWTFLYNLAHVTTLNFACSLSLLMIFYLKAKENFSKLSAFSKEMFQVVVFLAIRKRIVQNLQFFFEINRMYGKTFLVCMVIYCPVNTLFTVWLTHGKVQLQHSFTILFFVIYEFNFLFSIHLLLTYCTRHIHRPAKPYLSLMAENQHRVGLIRTRMKLINDILALSTTHRYGFTYGNFGLISLAAFSKVRYSPLKL